MSDYIEAAKAHLNIEKAIESVRYRLMGYELTQEQADRLCDEIQHRVRKGKTKAVAEWASGKSGVSVAP